MTDSGYPGQLDDDVVLPRVDDNITEIGGEAINGLRSAVFAIEACLGINPQGTAADLATRLDKSLNPDGSIRASALSSVGLVTLPIVNSMVASNAGIQEMKLDLDYPTVDLKTWIDSLWTFAYALSDAVNQDIYNLTQHVAHPGAYGRHRTSDVDGYEGYYIGSNLQGIVNDLYTRITGHVGEATGAHAASAISFDDQGMDFVAVDVQTALEELDVLHMAAVRSHQDNQHSNGLLKTQKTYYGGTNRSYVIVAATAVTAVTVGANYVVFPSPPGALAQVRRDDVIDITVGGETYGFYIKSVDATSGIVTFWGTLPVGGNATAAIHRTNEELSEPSVLALTIRQETSTGIIQMIHPDSPYILSSGLDLRKLSASVANVKFGWDGGTSATLNVYAAMQAYPPPGPTLSGFWTVENLAVVLNNMFGQVSLPYHRYPLVAFAYRGEIGIAFDEPTGYVEALACTNSAWTALGFDGTEKAYSLGPRRFYLDGYEFSSVRLMADANGVANGAYDIENIDRNLAVAGVKAPGLVRITSSNPANDGTYVYSYVSGSGDLLTIDGYNIPATDACNVRIYSDTFAVQANPSVPRTLYELFVDGYGSSSAELRAAERLTYDDGPGASGSPESWFDIIDVSRTFAACERRINVNSNVAVFGEQDPTSGSKAVLNPGSAVNLPIPASYDDAIGFRFRLYDGYGVDYIELEIASSGYRGALENAIDITILDRISEEHHAEIGVVLHNTAKFKHLSDRRLFGTVGRKDVREDYTRDYVTYPTSLLRGNGVIYGMGVRASSISSNSVSVDGGQVLVNGIVYTVGAQSLRLPQDAGATTYNLFVDDIGTLKLLEEQNLIADQPTPTLSEIIGSYDKVIIATVDSTAGNLVDGFTDLRRFVNNLDNKLSLIVGQDEMGSFASLEAAAAYLTACDRTSIWHQRRIVVNGPIDLVDSVVDLPRNTILEGDSSGAVWATALIIFHGTAGIRLSSGAHVRDLTFYSDETSADGFLRPIAGNGYMTVERCWFEFESAAANNNAIRCTGALHNVTIRDNMFFNVGAAVVTEDETTYVDITNNWISQVLINGINLNAPYGVNISGNKMITSAITMAAGTAFIRLVDSAAYTKVMDNVLIHDAAQVTSAGSIAMIDASGGSMAVEGLLIERNFLANVYAGFGFAAGIICSSGGSPMTGAVVHNNMLYNFSATAVGQGMLFSNCPQAIVSHNQIIRCAASLYAGTCDNIIVVDNIIQGGVGASSGHLNLSSCAGFAILGNVVSADGANFLASTSSCNNGTICNNFFEYTGTAYGMLLDARGNGNIIANNKFVAGTLTAGEPLQVVGSNNLATSNSFSITTPASTNLINLSGTGNVETLNKGQIYSVPIPLSWAAGDYLLTGWNQTCNYVSAIGKTVLYSITSGAVAEVEFSPILLPAGATLVEIKIRYGSAAIPASSSCSAGWNVTSWDGDTLPVTTVVAQTVLPGTSGIHSLATATLSAPASWPLLAGEMYNVYFVMTTTDATVIHGVELVYVL